MTGEITLTGPGAADRGLKEKVLAAQRAGIKRVIVPKRNEGDVAEIPEHERRRLEFVYVRATIDEGARGRAVTSSRPAGICSRVDREIACEEGSRWQQEHEGAGEQGARRGAGRGREPLRPALIEDEELRDNLSQAYDVGARRLQPDVERQGARRALLDDKKVQKDLSNAADSLRDASDALRERKAQAAHVG